MKTYSKSQVARHFKDTNGWIIIDDKVYDVSNYINIHPGGGTAVKGYLGRDASLVFKTINGHLKKHVKALLDRFFIGTCTEHPEMIFFNENENYGHTLLKAFASVDMQYSHSTNYPLNLLYFLQAHHQFCCDHLVTIYENLSILEKKSEISVAYEESYKLAEHLKKTSWLTRQNVLAGQDVGQALRLLAGDLTLIESLLLSFLDFSEAENNPEENSIFKFVEHQHALINDWKEESKNSTVDFMTMLPLPMEYPHGN